VALRSRATARYCDLARAADFVSGAIAGFIGSGGRWEETPASGRPDASGEVPALGFCCHNPFFNVCRGVKHTRNQSQARAGQQLTATFELKSCPNYADLK
jgi:hypothetical protein